MENPSHDTRSEYMIYIHGINPHPVHGGDTKLTRLAIGLLDQMGYDLAKRGGQKHVSRSGKKTIIFRDVQGQFNLPPSNR